MSHVSNLQLLEKVNEASIQLLGALADGDWALAQQISTYRQSWALRLTPEKNGGTPEFEQQWQRHLLLDHQLRAALEIHRASLEKMTRTKSALKTNRGIEQYQKPTNDQTD